MENNESKRKTRMLVVVALTVCLVTIATTAAYFVTTITNQNQEATVRTGTMALTFADKTNGITKALSFGESIEKEFTLKNTGTLDVTAAINWDELINMYLEQSLTYKLEYATEDGGEYTEIISANVPTSDTPVTISLAGNLSVPAGETYYYKLTITLENLADIDQTADLNAMFSTKFSLTENVIEGPSASEKTLAALDITPHDDEPDFSKMYPVVAEYVDNEFTNTPESYGYGPSTTWYVTYSDSYSYNSETGKYTLINPQHAKLADVTDILKGKYLASSFLSSTDEMQEYEEVYAVKVDGVTVKSDGDITLQLISPSSTRIYDYTRDGVYDMEDDYGTSYYYRGAVNNNYVKFGKWSDDTPDVYRGYYSETSTSFTDYASLSECQNASRDNVNCTLISKAGKDMYWRIIRINGDGSLRIRYDGTQAYVNGTANEDKTAFNNVDWHTTTGDVKYVGYMFGGADGVASTMKYGNTSEAATYNETSSNAKILLEGWYSDHLEDNYSKYLTDVIFCNDRSTSETPNVWSETDTALGYGNNNTVYAGGFRDYTYQTGRTPQPTFICPEKETDGFTAEATISNKGNGALDKPIGLITADEMVAAGAHDVDANFEFYLYGINAWTMTPYSYSNGNGWLYTSMNYVARGAVNMYSANLVPVINLSAETARSLIGDGTIGNEYRLPGDTV